MGIHISEMLRLKEAIYPETGYNVTLAVFFFLLFPHWLIRHHHGLLFVQPSKTIAQTFFRLVPEQVDRKTQSGTIDFEVNI